MVADWEDIFTNTIKLFERCIERFFVTNENLQQLVRQSDCLFEDKVKPGPKQKSLFSLQFMHNSADQN